MKRAEREVVIVGAARTPIGRHCGFYSNWSAEDLGVEAVGEVVKRSGIDLKKTKVDQVVAGMIYTDSRCQKIYLPRNVAMRAAQALGDKENLATAPGKTTLRICGTGFQVIADAYDLITAESPHRMDTVLSFGTESMTQTNKVHQGARKKGNPWDFEEAPIKDFLLEGFQHYQFNTLMPLTADKYGKMIGITRDDCDKYALVSHERAKTAQLKQWNRYATAKPDGTMGGIFSLDGTDQSGEAIHVWRDEGTRHDISLEELSSLPAIMGPGTIITAGNASQISDGAAAMMLMDRAAAEKAGLKILARVKGYHFSTVDPTIMGQGPVPAVKALMDKLGLTKKDIDLFEVNEAFAAQYLAVEKELGLPRETTNVNGGAVAMGHNIAATGLRITVDLIYELKRRGQKTGLASACIGGGQGGALCVEIID